MEVAKLPRSKTQGSESFNLSREMSAIAAFATSETATFDNASPKGASGFA